MFADERSPSEAKGLAKALGVALAVIGLAQIVAGTEAMAPGQFRALMLGHGAGDHLSWLVAANGGADRSAIAGRAVTGLCILAGMVALWRFPIDLGTAAHPWLALLGVTAILLSTWRRWGAPLAFTGIAAFLCVAIWHGGLASAPTSPIDIVRDIAKTLWFNPDNGALGWVPGVLLSTVLPVFLLGSLLASRTFLGLSIGPDGVGTGSAGKAIIVVQAVCRFLMPTLVIGTLVMTAWTDIDLRTAVVAWPLPVGIGLVWFSRMPVINNRAPRPAMALPHDALLIGAALATVMLARFGGLSLLEAVIPAIGVVVAFSACSADIRRRPMAIIRTFAESGIAFSRLLIALSTVGLVLAVIDRTGLPFDLAQLLVGATGEAWLPLVLLAIVVSGALGIAMPGVAAYLIVTALTGPSLRTVGLDDLTIHLTILSACAIASAATVARAASAGNARSPTNATSPSGVSGSSGA